MSLCFKWSCDFHQFTKSKTLRISGSHYTQFPEKPSQAFSLFNLQGTIRCFQGLFRTFRSSLPFSVTAYLVYQIVFSLSRTFFKFFKLFSTCATSFRSSLFSISNREAFVKKFFQLFCLLSVWSPLFETCIVYLPFWLLSTVFYCIFTFVTCGSFCFLL